MIMSKNLVTVVIPAFNKPEYTRKTIESVMLQTHRPIEIILSDDNSPESLKDLVYEKIAECNPGLDIKYFRQKVNLNYYWNLQFVLGEATGQYIILLDHDDWLIDCNYFSDSIKAMEDQANCYLSIANTFIENIPGTMLNFYYNNWHYVDGPAFMQNHLFSTVHPSRSAVMLRFDKLKELDYKKFFVEKESANIMKIMPEEALVSMCLLASVGNIALTGRVVSVKGMPPESLSRTTLWNKDVGQKHFIPWFLLYQYFKKIVCSEGMQAMSHNLLRRYPCKHINVEMLKYLNFNRSAITFMISGALWFNFRRISLFPRRIAVILRSIMIRVAKKIFLSTLESVCRLIEFLKANARG